jgi:hypothetical protein
MEGGERILDHWEFPLILGFFFWFPGSRLGAHFILCQAPPGKDYEIEIIVLGHDVSPSRAWAKITVPKQELGNEKNNFICPASDLI